MLSHHLCLASFFGANDYDGRTVKKLLLSLSADCVKQLHSWFIMTMRRICFLFLSTDCVKHAVVIRITFWQLIYPQFSLDAHVWITTLSHCEKSGIGSVVCCIACSVTFTAHSERMHRIYARLSLTIAPWLSCNYDLVQSLLPFCCFTVFALHGHMCLLSWRETMIAAHQSRIEELRESFKRKMAETERWPEKVFLQTAFLSALP